MASSDSAPIAVGALATSIAQVCSDDEIALLAAIFTQLGDSLAVILAARECNKNFQNTSISSAS